MARHTKKHSRKSSRRGYSAFGFALPKVSDIKKSAKGMDILMGAALGIAGIVGLKYAYNKLTAPKADGTPGMVKEIPALLAQFAPAVGGVLAGTIAYALYHKKSNAKATGWLIGSIGTGVAITAANYVGNTEWVKANTSFLVPADASAAAKASAGGGFAGFGLLTGTRPRGTYGLLQRDNMARLSAMAMADMGGAEELESLLS
ncbi:MAG: hypothetical protein KKD10_07310 [Candidatus Omnitrophica bacterium]|nr:hypothetical protein [Candidatus Omnitrophota bacterium]